MGEHTPTPGPWFVGYKPDGDPIDGLNGDYYFDGTVFSGDDDETLTVAQCIDSEADAHLIAAAPELLQALQAINQLCNAPHWTAERRWKIAKFANAVIRKAEGRPVRSAAMERQL